MTRILERSGYSDPTYPLSLLSQNGASGEIWIGDDVSEDRGCRGRGRSERKNGVNCGVTEKTENSCEPIEKYIFQQHLVRLK